jgi:hypothetical protein
MRNDVLMYGGQQGSSWYFQYERDALVDPYMAEKDWFPEIPPNPVERMREQFAKYAAMTEEKKQAQRDRLMAVIDRALEQKQVKL